MEITLTRSNAPRKDERLVIFNIEGRKAAFSSSRRSSRRMRFPRHLKLTGEFAPPKVKETPEERKARLKALPKPTPAERLAKMEERLAKMKAKLATAPAPPTGITKSAEHTTTRKGRK